MNTKTRWVVGIDPGFGMTGVVLRQEKSREVVAWACYCLPRENAPGAQVLRSASLAQAVADCISGWIIEHEISVLEVCIELPIYSHNAAILILQIRLFEDIEQAMAQMIVAQVEQLWLTEMYPATSKSLLAGNGAANKRQMILASPFAGLAEVQEIKEAIADAYAHSLSAGKQQYDLTSMKMVVVEAAAEGKVDTDGEDGS
jgi:Holliday junction resolvasome RuvABC endonuclease subunit